MFHVKHLILDFVILDLRLLSLKNEFVNHQSTNSLLADVSRGTLGEKRCLRNTI